jgi:hypothetical protein
VLLLPIQLSILHVPSPAVTPTNLLFNVGSAPGGLVRFWKERRLFNDLTRVLVAGTMPGVVAGANHVGEQRRNRRPLRVPRARSTRLPSSRRSGALSHRSTYNRIQRSSV